MPILTVIPLPNPLFNSNTVREIFYFFNKSLREAIIYNNNNINNSIRICGRGGD